MPATGERVRARRDTELFQTWLKRQREAKGWTPAEAAQQTGVYYEAAWIGYEEGERCPQANTAKAIARALKVDPNEPLLLLGYLPEQLPGFPRRLTIEIEGTFEGKGLEEVRDKVVSNWIADWQLKGQPVHNPNDLVSLELFWSESLIGNIETVRWGMLSESVPQRPREVRQVHFADYDGPLVSIRFTAKEGEETKVHMRAKLTCGGKKSKMLDDLLNGIKVATDHEQRNTNASFEVRVSDPVAKQHLLEGIHTVTKGEKVEPRGLTVREMDHAVYAFLLNKMQ